MIYCGDMNLIRVVLDSLEYTTVATNVDDFEIQDYYNNSSYPTSNYPDLIYEDTAVGTPLIEWSFIYSLGVMVGLKLPPIKLSHPGINTNAIHPDPRRALGRALKFNEGYKLCAAQRTYTLASQVVPPNNLARA